jgi:predicted nucleotidyltransferase
LNTDIRLYGSCATGLALPDSDIDLGILGFEMISKN